MIDITKGEMDYLISKGRINDIHMSNKTHKARAKTRFVTESPKTMKLLTEYRNKHILEAHE